MAARLRVRSFAMATIQQRGDSWRVFWRFGGRGGKTQSTTWPSQARAEQANNLAKAHGHRITDAEVYALILGEASQPAESTGPTLREWCATWLPAKTRITSGTRGTYERQLDNRILPVLGDIAVDKLTPTDIGRLVNELRADGLSNGTITRYYALLHGALSGAVAEGLRPDNPCARSDFVRDQVAEDDEGDEGRVYLTPEQYRLLLVAFSPVDQPLIELLVGTGMRWSEATALRVGDLLPLGRWDSARSTWAAGAGPRVRVVRAWKLDESSRPYLGTTKGRQKRTVDIDEHLHATLARLAAGRPADALLFTASRGGRIAYCNFYNRNWAPAVARAQRCAEHPPPDEGLPLVGASGSCGSHGGVRTQGKPCKAEVVPGLSRCRSHRAPRPNAVSTCDCDDVLRVRPTPHDLRHTHAAWLFADPNVAPLAISRRLGHASLATTSEIYGGLMPSAEMAAVEAISLAMRKPAPHAGPATETAPRNSGRLRRPAARPRTRRLAPR